MTGERPPPHVLALVGPTAVGKTGLSLGLASAAGRRGRTVEIVSADSRQIYRPLTIGTAKPTAAERAVVRHHFVDEKALDEPYSAGQFAAEAEARIAAIRARGALPLVVGGSTLYVEALVHGLADIPPTTEATREGLSERLAREGAAALFAELREADPTAAATMDATKSQRIVRALEVLHDTGRPLSYWQARTRPPAFVHRVHVLTRPRAELYARIEQRVDAMLEAGLLDEVRGLLAAGADSDAPALRTIGYREPIAHLSGAYDYDEMVRLLKRNTRRYAKRQLTWFRRRPAYIWTDVSATSPEILVERLLPSLLGA